MDRSSKGSITVFLSLMLVILITITSLGLESAHQQAVGSVIAMKGEEAGMNLFSHFERQLYEKYDLLAFNDRLNGNELLNASMGDHNPPEGAVFHLNYELEQLAMSESQYLGDKNGEGFQQEVNEIVTEELAKKLKKEISEYLKAARESESVTQEMNLMFSEEGNLNHLLEILSNLGNDCLAMNRIAKASKDALNRYYEAALAYQIGDMTFAYKTMNDRKSLEHSWTRLEQSVSSLLTSTLEYKQLALELSVNMQKVNNDLQQEGISKENKDAMAEQILSIRDLTDQEGKTFRKVDALERDLNEIRQSLKEVSYPDLETVTAILRDGRNPQPLFTDALNLVDKLEHIGLNGEKDTVSNSYSHSVEKLIKTVKEIMEMGPYAYMIGDVSKVSERKVESAELPSLVYKKNSSEDSDHLFRRMAENTIEACAMNYYLSEYLGCYTDGKQYDLEYVLGGKYSDEENLKIVINQLVLARSALNLVYLMKDSEKREIAELAGIAFSMGLGIPALEKVASYVVLSAWAYAEAVMDVKTLLKGGKVAFFKTKENWQLDLEAAAELDQDTEGLSKGKKGLSYKEYLRLMLFFHSRMRNLYRGLDMIQWNLCQSDPEFRIRQCIYETNIRIQARAPYLFLGNSLQEKLLPDANQIRFSKKVGYRSIEWTS